MREFSNGSPFGLSGGGVFRRLRLAVGMMGGLALFIMVFAVSDPANAQTCQRTLQQQINATPAGGTLSAAPCVYREQVTVTKPITIKGYQGAQIRGSDVWKGWTKSGSYWRSNLQLKTLPAGTDIHCNPNTYRCKWPEQVFVNGSPLTQVASNPGVGQFSVDSNRRVVLGQNPYSSTVEVSTRRAWVLGSTQNVVIEGFVMKHAATEGRAAALMNRTSRTGKGYGNWVVRNNRLSDSHGGIVSLKGASGLKVLGNEIARGGQIGVQGASSGAVISGNDIHHNNTEDFESLGKPGVRGAGEAGGIKITEVDNSIFTGNTVHHNNGNGIHYDMWSDSNTISNNRIYNNTRRGIHYEISSGGKIFDNVLYENGWGTPDWVNGAAIGISNSSDTEVYNNTLAWNADGIAVVSLDRAGVDDDHVKKVYVHDNLILSRDDKSDRHFSLSMSWIQSWSNTLTNPSYYNRGENNRYWNPDVEGSQARYRWGTVNYKNLGEFQRTRGENGASYMSSAMKDNIVGRANIPGAPQSR